MKRKQITAILMSAIMTVSACMPMNGISAWAAETAGTGATEVAAEAAAQKPAEAAAAQQEAEVQEPEKATPEAEPEKTTPEAESTQELAAEPQQEASSETDATGASVMIDESAVGTAEAEPVEAPAEAELAADSTEADATVAGEAAKEASAAAGEAAKEATAAAGEAAKEGAAATDAAAKEATAAADATAPEEIAEEPQLGKTAKEAEYYDYDSAVDITADSSAEFSVNNESPYYFFRFIPAKTGTYRFYTNGYTENIELVDEYHNFLTDLYSSDEGSSGIEYELRKGKTYYYRVSVYEEATVTAYLETVSVHSLQVDGEDEQTLEVYCDPATGPEKTTLTIIAESENEITYEWCDVMGEVVGTTPSYTFTPNNTSAYYCTISDGNETVHRRFYINLNHFMATDVSSYNPDEPLTHYAEYGKTTTLTANVSADDTSQLNYSWSIGRYVEEGESRYWSYEPVADGGDLRSFETEAITGPTKYSCYVSDQYGNGASIYYDVFVDNNFKAYVITDPNNIDVNNHTANLECVVGEDITFEVGVQADDMSGITYQWKKYDEVIDGATSNTYTATDLTGGESYTCTVTDQYGTPIDCVFSFTTTIYPYIEPNDDSHNIYLDPGESATFAADVDTNLGNRLSYIWYYNDEIIPGETGEALNIDGAALSGMYKVKVYYKDIYVFESFYVTRENNFSLRAKNSADVKVPAGASADLEVVATADDAEGITYQWYMYNNEEEATPIDGATSPKYTVPSVTSAAEYCCEARDKYNTEETVYFDVRVDNNLSVHIAGESADTNDASINVKPGETARLEVAVTANDMSQINYAWYRDDTEETVENTSGVYEFVPSGYTYVRVAVTDQYGNKAYAYFYVHIDTGLTVNPEVHTPGGNALPCERTENDPEYVRYRVLVPAGEGIVLNPNASVEQGDITYNWDWYDPESYDYTGSSAAQLTIDACNERNSYTCRIRDDYDNCIELVFEIVIDNQLVVYPEGAPGNDTKYIYVAPGSEVTLTTIAEAVDKDGINYDWDFLKNGNWLDEEGIAITENSVTLIADGNYEVRCWVYDRFDNEKGVTFYVYPDNHFTAYPENAEEMWNGSYSNYKYIDAQPGEALDLRVIAEADNKDGITYAWSKEVKVANIAGEYEYTTEALPDTGDTIHITADESTQYGCTVKDGMGGVRRVTFDITVGSLIAYPEGAAEVDGMPSSRVAIVDEAGGTRTLRVITLAPENEPLTYKWTSGPLNDSGWWPLEEGKDSTTNELTIDLDTAQRYLCVVSDTHGNQGFAYFYVNVGGVRLTSNFGTPELVGDNSYTIRVPVKVGEETTLQAILVGSSAENVTYRWLGDEYDTIQGATGNSYTFTGGVGSRYTCKVKDANGVTSKLTFYLDTDNELRVNGAVVRADGSKETSEAAGTNGKVEMNVPADKGEALTLSMDVSCLNNQYLHYEWVDALGRPVGEAATLPVTADENANYTCRAIDSYGNRAVVVFRVLTDVASLEDAEITLEKISYAFDGNAKTPAVTVVLKGKTLIAGQDYTVSYKNNVDPGTASAVVTGKTVAGERTVNFTIEKIPQTPSASVDEIVVAVGATKKFTVSGSHTPLSLSGVKTATATAEVSEQTVSVKGVKVGTYKLTVKAAANDVYAAGTVKNKSGKANTITIYVVPGKTSAVTLANANKGIKVSWKKVSGATGYVIKRQAGSGSWTNVKTVTSGNTVSYTDAATAANTNGTKYTYRVFAQTTFSDKKTKVSDKYTAAVCYKVARPAIKSLTNSASKKMTVKWAKNAKANGYQIQYSLKSNFSGAKKWDSKKNSIVSKVFGSLTKGKKYYVRMRTYKKVGSKYYYSTWSATKTVVIKK